MSRIDEMIQALCPNGVRIATLDEVCEVANNKRKPVKSSLRTSGSTPYYGANNIQDYVEGYTHDGEYVLIAEDGSASLSNYSVQFAIGKFWANNHVHVVRGKDHVDNRFLFHFISAMNFTPYLTGGTRAKLNKSKLLEIKVPVPPLEIQKEIANILDKFTRLEAELSTELDSRRKQYEYYRNGLLTFGDDVEWIKLGKVTRIFSSSRVHKNEWTTSGVPFYRSSDVISKFNNVENSRGKAYISHELYETLSAKSGQIKKDDILITGGGTIGIPYIVPSDEPLHVKDADLLCIQKSERLNSKFLYHFFLTTNFRQYLKNITHDATIAHYTISQIANTPVPLPTLEEQSRIVALLDSFEGLTNDITIGLPAEIAARRKQYEYYRTKLLTFQELPV